MPRRDALTDVAGIRVGHWTDRRNATGCTVVLCPPGTVGGVDVRGAAPGTRETDLLRPGNLIEEVHAVVLAGGSAFGLEAASGVMRELATRGIGLSFNKNMVPIVPSAILFDLGLGNPKHPTADAGRRALARASGGRVDRGSVGAGTGATVAKQGGFERAIKGGLGTASEHLDTGAIVAAIVAVNAVGSVRDPRSGETLAAPRDDERGFLDLDPILRVAALRADEETVDPPTNTTLAVVATNARLTKTQINRVATVAHDGFASTIWPVHSRSDGDVVFGLATGELEVDAAGYRAVEAFAVRAVERAVLDAVRSATSLAGIPSVSEWAAR
jgi:L-aminopeptidase/D-esterase-like protein